MFLSSIRKIITYDKTPMANVKNIEKISNPILTKDIFIVRLLLFIGLYDLFCYNFTPLAEIFTPPP